MVIATFHDKLLQKNEYELPHQKTSNLHIYTADQRLCFATRIVQSICSYIGNTKLLV